MERWNLEGGNSVNGEQGRGEGKEENKVGKKNTERLREALKRKERERRE